MPSSSSTPPSQGITAENSTSKLSGSRAPFQHGSDSLPRDTSFITNRQHQILAVYAAGSIGVGNGHLGAILHLLSKAAKRARHQWLWTMPRRYNVPPTEPLPVMTSKDGVRTVEPMRWGLIPSWSKDMKGGFSTFNARADGIDTKPSFKGAWKAGRRCLVLVGGFFEWRKAGPADKQPFAFAIGNHEIMTLAGLWEPWKNPEDGQWLRRSMTASRRKHLGAP